MSSPQTEVDNIEPPPQNSTTSAVTEPIPVTVVRGEQPTVWRLFRRAPLAVWFLVLLQGLLGVCWSILTPQFHAPDEPNHAEAVMRLVTGQGWARIGHAFIGPAGVGAVRESPYGSPSSPYTLDPQPIKQSDAVPRKDRPSWADLGKERLTSQGPIQQIVQHPPGYYWLAAGAVALTGGADQPWDRAVEVMRLVSALLIAPLPLLAWAACSRLVDRPAAALGAAVVPLGIPQLAHSAGSVNNDNLLIFAGGLVTVGVACALRGDRSLRTALFTGVSLGIGLFAKSLAIALLPMVVFAYLVPWLYARRAVPDSLVDPSLDSSAGGQHAARPSAARLGPRLAPLAVTLVVAFVLGGWWYAVNEVRYGAIQPDVPGFPPGLFLGNDHAALVRFATKAVFQRYWGSFGWFEANLSWTLVVIAIGVCVLLVLAALLGTRRPRGTSVALLVMLTPTTVSYLLMVKQAVSKYLATHYYSALAGRYLFVGVVGAAVVLGVGAAVPPLLRRWSPVVLLAAVAVMQFAGVRVGLHRWWVPPKGGLRGAWDALSSWSAWPPVAIQLIVALTAAAAVVVLVTVVKSCRDAPESGLRPPTTARHSLS